jgi:hypothetical protein
MDFDWARVGEDLLVGVVSGVASSLVLLVLLHPDVRVSAGIKKEDDGRYWIKIANFAFRSAIDISLSCRLRHSSTEAGQTRLHLTNLGILSDESVPFLERQRLTHPYEIVAGGTRVKSRLDNRFVEIRRIDGSLSGRNACARAPRRWRCAHRR